METSDFWGDPDEAGGVGDGMQEEVEVEVDPGTGVSGAGPSNMAHGTG